MDKINNNLSIIINCEEKYSHCWMSFASWYSIYNYLPDANVCLLCKRLGNFENLFSWCSRVGVKCYRISNKIEKSGFFEISPSVMVVREGNLEICSAKTNNYCTFVDYKDGCGKFCSENAEKIKIPPFKNAIKNFSTKDLSINEIKILKFWERCENLYNYLTN